MGLATCGSGAGAEAAAATYCADSKRRRQYFLKRCLPVGCETRFTPAEMLKDDTRSITL